MGNIERSFYKCNCEVTRRYLSNVKTHEEEQLYDLAELARCSVIQPGKDTIALFASGWYAIRCL